MLDDDRITCADCECCNAIKFKCRASGDYFYACRPLDLKHRCECYLPVPGIADTRTGAERWPYLVGQPGGPTRIPYPELKPRASALRRK